MALVAICLPTSVRPIHTLDEQNIISSAFFQVKILARQLIIDEFHDAWQNKRGIGTSIIDNGCSQERSLFYIDNVPSKGGEYSPRLELNERRHQWQIGVVKSQVTPFRITYVRRSRRLYVWLRPKKKLLTVLHNCTCNYILIFV